MVERGAQLHDVSIPAVAGGSDPLRAVLGIPDGEGPWPGVVAVHEAFGVDEEMRKQVAHLASMGYLTIMPDLFSVGGMRRCLVSTFRSLRTGTGVAYRDIEASREYLLALPEHQGGTGIIGFCMGGGFALMTAAGFGFQASAPNYGFLPKEPLDRLRGACPVVASYGGRDYSLRGAATRLRETLDELGVENDVKEYPEAGHSFLNEKDTGPAVTRPLERLVMGVGPQPEASADAWSRIDRFFRVHLTEKRPDPRDPAVLP